MKVTEDLANTEVLALNGESVRLGTLWDGKPAVLIWMRHYG